MQVDFSAFGVGFAVSAQIKKNVNLPNRISASRSALGLSKTTLAKKVGVSVAAVGQWEDGTIKDLKAETLLGLAKALNVSPYWLYTGHGSPATPEHLTIEEREVFDLYRGLTNQNRDAWLSAGRALLSSQSDAPSTRRPFKVRTP